MSASSSTNSAIDERNLEEIRVKIYDLFFADPTILNGFRLDPQNPDYDELRQFLATKTNVDFSIHIFTLGNIF
jgi:hypothetical protein